MAILFSNEIYAAICDELSSAEESVQILTAYGKTKAVAAIIDKVKPSIENKSIMLRFRLDDLVKGSTDFDVIDFCKSNGWTVYVRFDLHAKTYIVDNKRGIIGSANATNFGLALTKTPNYEMAALVDIEKEDINKIDNMFNDALLVDDDLWLDFNDEYSKFKSQETNGVSCQWSKRITNLFKPHISTLFSYEFPEKDHYSSGEFVQFLDMVYSEDKEVLRGSLRWSPSYLWLMDQLTEKNGEIFFGELSARLHSALVTDPKPYRKDVKQLLSNLLQMIIAIDMPEIGVDRPNHSQRIFFK